MGIDGIDKANIFDEYFDNKQKKVTYTIEKCRRKIGKQAWCRYFKSPCKNNPNCIWKQFEREQNRRIELENYFKKLEKENKELKDCCKLIIFLVATITKNVKKARRNEIRHGEKRNT